MTARRCTLEFVRTLVRTPFTSQQTGVEHAVMRPEWYWRFIASNGKELARSSETYRRRVDAISCAETVTGCYMVRELEALGFDYCHRQGSSDYCYWQGSFEDVNVRWLR